MSEGGEKPKLSRREFGEFTLATLAGALLAACGFKPKEPGSVGPEMAGDWERAVDKLDALLGLTGSEHVTVSYENLPEAFGPRVRQIVQGNLNLGKEFSEGGLSFTPATVVVKTPQADEVWKVVEVKPENPNKKASRKNFDLLSRLLTPEGISAAAVGALAEPTPLGELGVAALLLLAGTGLLVRAKPEMGTMELIELNSHSIERRGEELANYIKVIVEAAFMPNGPLHDSAIKKALCYAAAGIIEGCDRAVHLAVEIESRTLPGVKRVAALILGHDTKSDEWRMITALYKGGKNGGSLTLDEYEAKVILRHQKMNLSTAMCDDLPRIDKLLAGP